MRQLSVGSLFAGIGGIDLGLERTGGFKTAWFSEIDPFASAVLRKHWPDVPNFGDVRELGADTPRVDVLAGGFPCQPVSLAGKRLAQDDPRWLWPHVARLVGDLRPRYVFLENVPGLASAGLGDVVGDLTALGYDAEWDVISARSVGAPHLRERLWIVAYADSVAVEQRRGRRGTSEGGELADSNGQGRRREGIQPRLYCPADTEREIRAVGGGGEPHSAWAIEPDVGRVAYGVPARLDKLAALGNAVVPQVAEVVGRLILADAAR